jgi:hypothetical protein
VCYEFRRFPHQYHRNDEAPPQCRQG